MPRSRIDRNGRTTIPQAVRTALDLKPADEIAYEIEGRRVTLTKAGHPPAEDPFATFSEWDGEADARAYKDL
ncbi:type II toxin-antitoxin system PrlF family antitoxin [Microvirga sp. 2YAF29]|uniref:type II toxin-antitoxin system PrlF family antitoxin n=1 Tax=Microvirga sp. 2YAF29 TaxID=3233031 RepID=UPI003F9BBFA1